MKKLGNVSFIVIGVIIASFGEIQFVLIGFIFQAGGIIFEAIRLVMVQRLLSSAEFKMDPLVSLYYFAPVCAVMNAVASLMFEVHQMSMADLYNVGVYTLIANAFIAFMLNVSVVFLVRSFLQSTSPITYPTSSIPDMASFYRLERHHRSSSPSRASSRTFSLSSPQSSSSATRSRCCRHSGTASRLPVCCTTSLVGTS